MIDCLFGEFFELLRFVTYTGTLPNRQPERSFHCWAVCNHIYEFIIFGDKDEKKTIFLIFLSLSSLDQISADAPSKEQSQNTSISKTTGMLPTVGPSIAWVIIALAPSSANGTTTL